MACSVGLCQCAIAKATYKLGTTILYVHTLSTFASKLRYLGLQLRETLSAGTCACSLHVHEGGFTLGFRFKKLGVQNTLPMDGTFGLQDWTSEFEEWFLKLGVFSWVGTLLRFGGPH